MMNVLRPVRATRIMAVINTGNACMRSETRIKSSVAQFLKKPAIRPRNVPMTSEIRAEARAMVMSVRGAEIVREKISRPDESVPNQCGGFSMSVVRVSHKRPGHWLKAGGGIDTSPVAKVGS